MDGAAISREDWLLWGFDSPWLHYAEVVHGTIGDLHFHDARFGVLHLWVLL